MPKNLKSVTLSNFQTVPKVQVPSLEKQDSLPFEHFGVGFEFGNQESLRWCKTSRSHKNCKVSILVKQTKPNYFAFRDLLTTYSIHCSAKL